jgi:hypothetical protein
MQSVNEAGIECVSIDLRILKGFKESCSGALECIRHGGKSISVPQQAFPFCIRTRAFDLPDKRIDHVPTTLCNVAMRLARRGGFLAGSAQLCRSMYVTCLTFSTNLEGAPSNRCDGWKPRPREHPIAPRYRPDCLVNTKKSKEGDRFRSTART